MILLAKEVVKPVSLTLKLLLVLISSVGMRHLGLPQHSATSICISKVLFLAL
jgi:hypothetical protein